MRLGLDEDSYNVINIDIDHLSQNGTANARYFKDLGKDIRD